MLQDLLSDLKNTAIGKQHRFRSPLAVDVGSVGGMEVCGKDFTGNKLKLAVGAGYVRTGQDHVAGRISADDDWLRIQAQSAAEAGTADHDHIVPDFLLDSGRKRVVTTKNRRSVCEIVRL